MKPSSRLRLSSCLRHTLSLTSSVMKSSRSSLHRPCSRCPVQIATAARGFLRKRSVSKAPMSRRWTVRCASRRRSWGSAPCRLHPLPLPLLPRPVTGPPRYSSQPPLLLQRHLPQPLRPPRPRFPPGMSKISSSSGSAVQSRLMLFAPWTRSWRR